MRGFKRLNYSLLFTKPLLYPDFPVLHPLTHQSFERCYIHCLLTRVLFKQSEYSHLSSHCLTWTSWGTWNSKSKCALIYTFMMMAYKKARSSLIPFVWLDSKRRTQAKGSNLIYKATKELHKTIFFSSFSYLELSVLFDSPTVNLYV